ncbi:MAG: dephospho-CoA kinase [Ignavibacteriales bacterium]|nr:dephospho-CoA kinase [Ignavibacteriales bacterium]MBK7981909.1 dephospho-CoA kinase [Ignavibacteriota bacterium]
MNKLKIGITGGIGTGKTTVAKIIEANGFTVLNADDTARKLMQTDKEIRRKLIEKFGSEVFIDNKLNSKFISNIVFNDKNKLKLLNSIVHPATIKNISEEITERQKTENLIFVESALVFEAKMEELFDHVLLVTADDDKRIERIKIRNNYSDSEILKIIENQIPENIKKSKSDFIIINNGNLEDLKTKTEFFLRLFNSL